MPGAQPKGYATTVPKEVIQAFLPRETQISPLEALAVLQMTLLYQEDFGGLIIPVCAAASSKAPPRHLI